MTIRDADTARIANLRAALASIAAKAEKTLGVAASTKAPEHQALACGLALQIIHDAAEAAIKADERAGGKR